MGGWITRALAYRRDRADLEARLANAKKDADYWRNEYGNKQAELVEAQEKAELERNLNEATIKDLQGRNQALAVSKATLERDLADALATIRTTRVSQMEVKNKIVTFVQTVAVQVDQWNW